MANFTAAFGLLAAGRTEDAIRQYSRVLEFTWFGFAVSQWQILGVAAMILFGAIYEILPRVMEKKLPFALLAKANFYLFSQRGIARIFNDDCRFAMRSSSDDGS